MSDIITRWRAHCQECGHVSDDLRRCSNPVSRDRHSPYVNILKHMISHTDQVLDPNGTKERAECPICHSVLESNPKEIRRGTNAQHKLFIHYTSSHPEDAEKWFVSTGLKAPKMEELKIATDDWYKESVRLADEGDAKSPNRVARRKKESRSGARPRRRSHGKPVAPRTPETADVVESIPEPASPDQVSILPIPPITGSACAEVRKRVRLGRRREEVEVAKEADSAAIPGRGGEMPGAGPPTQPVLPDPAGPASGKGQAGEQKGGGDEFSDESLIGHLRGGRIARARAEEEEDDWASGGRGDDEDEAGGDSYLPFVRSRRGRRREDPESDGDTEEAVRGERRGEGGVRRGGKMALVAVLGLAVAGLGLLLWSKMRGKAGAERIPLGDLLAGGQRGATATGGQPTQTTVASQQVPQPTASPTQAESRTQAPPNTQSKTPVATDRGRASVQYADIDHKFL